MGTYYIKIVSQRNAIIFIFIFLAIFFSAVYLFIPHGTKSILGKMIFFGSLLAVYFLWQYFVTGRTKWIIDDSGIRIIWTKQFAFSNKPDTFIKWEDVKDISKGIDPNYYDLKIKLVSGEVLRFYHDILTTGDDFRECIKELKDKTERIKTK